MTSEHYDRGGCRGTCTTVPLLDQPKLVAVGAVDATKQEVQVRGVAERQLAVAI